MITDVQGLDSPPLAARYDVCIAGAGMAGIVLANALAAKGHKILLLEAGGLTWSDKSQGVYKGENIGHWYFDLDVARWRFLGGTSSHWAGWCRPLDDHDFKKFDHIGDSGWPIDIGDIAPYMAAASDILEIEVFPPDRGLKGADGELNEVYYRFSGGGGPGTVRFNEKYRDSLAESEAIDLFVHANVVEMVENSDTGRIASFRFRDYRDDGPVHVAKADAYVLAFGGIENPRALLNANKRRPNGLGNEFDHVGRYFMEHPVFHVGQYVRNNAAGSFGEARRFIAPTAAQKATDTSGNWAARIAPTKTIRGGRLFREAREVLRRGICMTDPSTRLVREVRPNFTCLPSPIPKGEFPIGTGRIKVAAEQVPNRLSRVFLGDDVDRFGQRRVVLDWRLTEMDKITFRNSALAVGGYFARQDIGRVKVSEWVLADDTSFPSHEDGEEVGGFHHLGTTRMATSARYGVVDRNCRMFDVDNLYVAGSSVFPTGGYANPTLTIVQLTLRLADHLVLRLA